MIKFYANILIKTKLCSYELIQKKKTKLSFSLLFLYKICCCAYSSFCQTEVEVTDVVDIAPPSFVLSTSS